MRKFPLNDVRTHKSGEEISSNKVTASITWLPEPSPTTQSLWPNATSSSVIRLARARFYHHVIMVSVLQLNVPAVIGPKPLSWLFLSVSSFIPGRYVWLSISLPRAIESHRRTSWNKYSGTNEAVVAATNFRQRCHQRVFRLLENEKLKALQNQRQWSLTHQSAEAKLDQENHSSLSSLGYKKYKTSTKLEVVFLGSFWIERVIFTKKVTSCL